MAVRLFSGDVRSATRRSGWCVHGGGSGQFSPQSATTSWGGQEYVKRVAAVFSADLLAERPKDGEEHRPLVLRQGPTLRRQRAVHRRAGRSSLWVSDAEPGSVHDLHAAHSHALPALSRTARAVRRSARRSSDPDGPRLHRRRHRRAHPTTHPDIDSSLSTDNRLRRGIRALGERATAELAQRWRTLRHAIISPNRLINPNRIGAIANARTPRRGGVRSPSTRGES